MIEPKTAAEAGDHLKSLIATRRGKLGVCTRRIKETKALMAEGGTIDDVDKCMHMFKQAVDEFNNVHDSVQELLSQEEKDIDSMDCYEPRVMNFNYFSKEVKTWKRQQSAQFTVDPLDSISNVSRRTAASSTSSAALLASAEKAALEAKAAALKEMHSLQLQETIIKSKMEKVELEAQIGAAEAKIKVLINPNVMESNGDAMN